MTGEWRSNTRLRILTYLAVVVAWGYGLLLLSDENRHLAELLTSRRSELQVLPGEHEREIWRRRLEESQQGLLAWNATTWGAKSASLAEASFRDFLSGAATAAGLKDGDRTLTVSHQLGESPARVDVRNHEDLLGMGQSSAVPGGVHLPRGYGILLARFDSPFTPQGLTGLLERIESEPRRIAVTRLQVRNPLQGRGAIEIEMRAVFRLATAEGGP